MSEIYEAMVRETMNKPIDKDVLMGRRDRLSTLRAETAALIGDLTHEYTYADLYNERKQLMEGLLRWKTQARTLGKQLGKAGQTIHNLRADIALLRSKDQALIGELYLQQRRDNDELRKVISKLGQQSQILRKENRELRQKLDRAEEQVGSDA